MNNMQEENIKKLRCPCCKSVFHLANSQPGISNQEEPPFERQMSQSRKPRIRPAFYMLNGALRMKYFSETRNKWDETGVMKTEYARVIQAFQEKLDPTGRLRWSQEDLKKLGINHPKVNTIKRFLVKMGTLSSQYGFRTAYANKQTFLKEASEAWEILKEKQLIEETE